MIEFKLPSLGADMDEGTLLTWQVKPGDSVKRGQIVAVVDTSKAAVDVEIWHDGIVQELRVQPGEKIPVGTILATLQEVGEPATPALRSEPKIAAPTARRAISPSARRRAQELGLDLSTLQGSGAQGSVTLADVEGAAPDRKKDMRRAIAAAMSRSKREIPHYYLIENITMSQALAWLQQHNDKQPITERLLSSVMLLKAVALALRRTPELNGFYRDGEFQPSTAVHLGVAISLRGGGLVAPALHDVGTKPLTQLMSELSDLVKRARAGSLRSSEMSDPTLTVTNLGDQSVTGVYGVIYPPQVALIGFGGIRVQPWVVEGKVQAVPIVCATLAADHRVSDGHRGALFLAELRELLQQPQSLADTFQPLKESDA